MNANARINFFAVCEGLARGWDEQTSQSSFWTPAIPAEGQCAVSSMVVQHFFGGEILRGVTNLEMVHYWNSINGVWIDTTRPQFKDDEYIVEHVVRPEDYLYRFQDTIDRFNLLLSRVRVHLGLDAARGEW